MNKKNILQNLLRRALTPAGTNMTRWTMALAVVMISLLAPTTVARAQQGFDTNQYTLTLDLNYEGAKKEYITNISSGSTIILPTPSRDDNIKCLGWATSAEGDVKYKPGDGFVVTQDQTLYAKWDKSTNGTFGDLSWSVTKSDGSAGFDVLTISGSGSMDNDIYYPWFDFWNSIKTIIIRDGVTSIAKYAFIKFSNVTSLTIPNSVQTIGDEAFEVLSSLTTDIVLPVSLTSIGIGAFGDVAKGTKNGISITAAEGSQLESIGSLAFGGDTKASIDLSNCTKLTTIGGEQTFLGTMDVTLPHTVTSIAQYAFGKVGVFSGQHAYIVVPKGKTLTVNGEPYAGTLTDGKADLIPYLFDNPPKQSKALTLAMTDAETYALSGDHVLFYPEDGYDRITKAEEGQKVKVCFDPDAQIGDNYFTGSYTSDDVTITVNEVDEGTFTMPAKAVTVTPVLAPQEEYTIDLTTATPQTIPESMWILLIGLQQYYVRDEESYEIFLDLNLDGKRDIQLKRDNNEATDVTTYSVVRQAGADDIDEDLRFPLSYVQNLQYNSVLFKLSKEAVQSGWITVADGTDSGTALVYNGQAQTPAVIVKDGETDVTSDFDVTYSNNKNAGEATADNAPTVTVTAKATSTSYTGSATKTFTIGRKALTLVANKVSIIEGEATPTTFTGSITGFVDGEGLGANDLCFFALDNPAASAVGSYAVTGKLNGSANGNYGQNYTFANAADNATAFTINSYQPESSTTVVQNPDGTTTTTTTIISEYEGFTQKDVTVTVKDQNGEVLSQTTSSETTNPDGNIHRIEETVDADGNIHRIEETVDANGNTTIVETVTNPVQLGGTATVTGSNGESTEFGLIMGSKDISISEITNQPIAIENGKEGAVTIEKTTKESFLANSTQNKSESTVTLRFKSSAFRAGMKITVLHQPDGSSTWEKITPDNVGDGECIVTFNSLARRHSATRGAKAARPFFRIDYSGANITCKAGDVELQAAEEAHGINRGDEQDIIIESGKTYDILTDKNLILTLQPSESDFLLTSFTMIVPEDSDPNDINGDGDVNAVDLVKAIAAGKTQAEIDAIVNVIMGK